MLVRECLSQAKEGSFAGAAGCSLALPAMDETSTTRLGLLLVAIFSIRGSCNGEIQVEFYVRSVSALARRCFFFR